MKDPRLFLFTLVLLGATCDVKAQNHVPDCTDIKVEVKTTQPSLNQSNGSIDFALSQPVSNYRIFFLNAGPDKTGKQEVENGKLTNLKSGSFDFLVIDKTKKGCVRQLTVVLN